METTANGEPPQKFRPLWGRSILWLLFLGPLFFLSYGYSNHIAASLGVEKSLFYEWERSIPFLPWTIGPYWVIDLFYGLSFLLCRTLTEVNRHALRLLTAQLISVACFLAFPLRFAFERPQVDGFFGTLFDALMGFDLPYNQAPSLHISLLVIIWARFSSVSSPLWRMVVNVLALLIGVSVLTTYQHHFIDVPTGALVGLLCLWLWPDNGSSPVAPRIGRMTRQHLRVGSRYLLAAAASCVPGFKHGGWALWSLWISLSLLLVCIIYFTADAKGFQKTNGRRSLAASLLLAPYLIGAWVNSRLWTLFLPTPVAITDDIWLGRNPSGKEFATAVPGGFSALVDFCPELSTPRSVQRNVSLPWLDLISPTTLQLIEAVHAIEKTRLETSARGPILVCCALGYSRSASAVIGWLYQTRRCASIDEAIALVQSKRPRITLSDRHMLVLRSLERMREESESADEEQ